MELRTKADDDCEIYKKKRLNERAFEVFEPSLENGGDVETDGHFLSQEGAKVIRHRAVSSLLLSVHRLGGQAERVARARLHLHKTVNAVLQGNDVRFPERGLVVAL